MFTSTLAIPSPGGLFDPAGHGVGPSPLGQARRPRHGRQDGRGHVVGGALQGPGGPPGGRHAGATSQALDQALGLMLTMA